MEKKRNGFIYNHYHWVVAVLLGLMLFVHGGSQNNFLALHTVPITEHLAISRGDFTLAYGLKGIVAMASTFVSGFVISKCGVRRMATLGLLMTAGAYVIFALAGDLGMVALGSILIGLSYGFCTTSAAVMVVRIWFHRYEGTVLGVVTAATGIGGSVLSVLQAAAMEAGSYRSSLYLAAGLMTVIAVLLFLLVRNRPEEIGLVPLGEGERIKKRPKESQVSYQGLPMKELWRQPAFWLMLFCVVLSNFGLYLAFNVVRDFFIDCGISVARATGLYSAMMLILTGTKLLSGFLCDKWGSRLVNMLCVGFGVVSLVAFGLTYNFGMAIAAVLLYTVSLPLMTLLGPLVASNLFGYRAYTQYTGVVVSAVSLSSLSASYVTNAIYDAFQSYRPSFWLAAVLTAVSGVLFLILYKMADKLKARTEQ